jgi:hypothetical protein
MIDLLNLILARIDAIDLSRLTCGVVVDVAKHKGHFCSLLKQEEESLVLKAARVN